MESASPNRTWGMTVVAVLALAQGVLGVMRTMHWIDVGSDLLGQGLLLLPAVGVIAMFRGALVATISLLYVLFAFGIFFGKGWAWWIGLFAAVVTIIVALVVLANGERLALVLAWIAVPVVMLAYLFSPSGRMLGKS